LVAEMAAALKASGRTLPDRLADLDAMFGPHVTRQVAVPTDQAEEVMARLLAAPPRALGTVPVVAVEAPAPDVLVLRLPAARVIVRPSGTEPKLKTYIEAGSAAEVDQLAAAIAALIGSP